MTFTFENITDWLVDGENGGWGGMVADIKGGLIDSGGGLGGGDGKGSVKDKLLSIKKGGGEGNNVSWLEPKLWSRVMSDAVGEL